MNKNFVWLYKHSSSSHRMIALNTLINTLTSLASVYFAVVMKRLIDMAVAGNNDGMIRNGAELVLLTVFIYASTVAASLLTEKTSVRVMGDVRQYLMKALMNKEYSDLTKKHSGEWMNLFFSDVKVISDGTASILPGIAGMISRLLFAFVLLLVMAKTIAAVYLISGAAVLGGIALFRGSLQRLHKDVQSKEDHLHALFQEVIENLLIVKVFRANEYFSEKTAEVQNDYSQARIKRQRLRLSAVNGFYFIFRMGYLSALLYGGYQLFQGRITYGTLTAVLHTVNQLQRPVFSLSGILPRIYEVLGSTDRIREIERNCEQRCMDTAHHFYGLKAKGMKFSYDRDPVLENADFEIQRNDTVALTGISGIGKSTLFLLILGLYQASEGDLEINSEKGWQKPDVRTRSLFTYVPQGNALFTGSIQENVVFNRLYDAEKFKKALITADAYEFVESLPEKEKTRLGERGTGLSEGQIQRLAIARAVYADTPVMLLDESTSALDELTEARVLNNLKGLADKTILIVTHRPAALKICNKFLLFENKQIIEKNTTLF